jgi:hypothetical protein
MNDLTVSDDEMALEENHAAVKQHWRALATGDLEREHAIYHDGAELEYPQSGELFVGRANIRGAREAQPGPVQIETTRILGQGDLWISEIILTKDGRQTNVVSIMEFREGRVFHESQYFAEPFEAPSWRATWSTSSRRK